MSDSALKEYIQPFPGIGGFIFVPPETGESRTWIFRATDDPQHILDFHFSSFMTQGWNVVENGARVLAERGGEGVSVSASRRKDETRIIYEVIHGGNSH